MKQLAFLTLALAVLAGCATVPHISYYTLDMAPQAAAQGANIVVDQIRVAEAVMRKEIMIKTTPTQVEYYAEAQWVAGLDELLTEKLATEFGTRDPKAEALFLDANLLAFEQVDVNGAAEAHMKLAVTLTPAGEREPVFEKTYEITRPTAGTPAAVVETLSACVEEIAAQIAGDAAGL